MVDQPKENELDEEKEATASSKEAKRLTAEAVSYTHLTLPTN